MQCSKFIRVIFLACCLLNSVVYAFNDQSHNENSNLTRITPPARPTHAFTYSAADLTTQYTPPTLDAVPHPQTQYRYNLDKQLTHIQRPDGQVIELVYDAVKKRTTQLRLPNDTAIHYRYDETTGQLAQLTAPDGNTLTYTYYRYDILGNLTQVQLPDGTDIEKQHGLF